MAKEGDAFARSEDRKAGNFQAPQAPDDQHGAKYDNDAPEGWLRSDGTQKPGFDKGNAWRKGRGL